MPVIVFKQILDGLTAFVRYEVVLYARSWSHTETRSLQGSAERHAHFRTKVKISTPCSTDEPWNFAQVFSMSTPWPNRYCFPLFFIEYIGSTEVRIFEVFYLIKLQAKKGRKLVTSCLRITKANGRGVQTFTVWLAKTAWTLGGEWLAVV